MLRRLVSRRRGLVKRRTQVKNEISAVLHRNLKGANPASDPFGKKGRAWIAAQQLPIDERLTVDGCLRQLDFFGDELAEIDRLIAQQVLGDEDVRRLMTIPGIDVVTAATLVAVIGDVRRFPTSRQLVGYLGLHPTIRQSGNGPARHGRLSKEGLGRRPPCARRGRLVGCQGTGAAARLRPAHRRPARPPRRDRGRRAQARRARVAPADPR
jgi:transposase